MKVSLLALPVLLCVAAAPAGAAFFQWTDAKGVAHFTDDAKKVPKKYRDKAKRLKLPAETAPAAPSAQPQGPAAQPPAAHLPPPHAEAAPGGHPEAWWRQRFASLRRELKTRQDVLALKQEKLVELRRERRIFTRVRDREAVNAMEGDISADEVQISDLLKQIEALEQEAARAAVPVEWRR